MEQQQNKNQIIGHNCLAGLYTVCVLNTLYLLILIDDCPAPRKATINKEKHFDFKIKLKIDERLIAKSDTLVGKLAILESKIIT